MKLVPLGDRVVLKQLVAEEEETASRNRSSGSGAGNAAGRSCSRRTGRNGSTEMK